MKLVTIIGPQAVGKMTVGQELAKITGLKLYHNHMAIEAVSPIFSYSTIKGKGLVHAYRKLMFEEVAKSDLEGMIFTRVWAFDLGEKEEEYYNNIKNIFLENGAEIYLVELEADFEERIRRNETENRLEHKPTKRNIEWSRRDIIKSNNKHRLNSLPGEIKEKNYLRINNTNISPEEVAKIIKEKFNL